MSGLMRYLDILLLIGATMGDNCSKHCRPALNGEVNCKSGGCDEGCMDGFFGETCEGKCSEHCIGDICSVDDGTCSGGCEDNYCGDQCTRTCDAGLDRETTKRNQAIVSSQDTTSATDLTMYRGRTEMVKKRTSSTSQPENITVTYTITGKSQTVKPATSERETPDRSKILLYSGVGIVVLVVNSGIICFLYFSRRILYRTNTRIGANHASVGVIELACIPQRTKEVSEVGKPTSGAIYLTASHDSAEIDIGVASHEYDVIDSTDLESVMVSEDCFDDFVRKSTTDCLSPDYSGGKYISPI